ncbi:non-ribosomal peptide synthetase [Amycolatopsis sp. MtRt-6]|uniref:non-ribosomal peptide synthetase n=1 Tax=Amycolatopsis sp. MtRt-6 TaxID=2792782 RepID=UPI001A8E6F83|nr:non-ribosomal peptide synthetase [Amycolatopsis sp. MtRt-6]
MIEPARDDRPALLAEDGTVTTYRELAGQVDALSAWLRGVVAPDQVVAVAMGNSPSAVAMLLAAASVAVCAPLPPGQPAADLGASVLITDSAEADVPVIRPFEEIDRVSGPRCSVPGTALLVRTSGSTGAAKLVPLPRAAVRHAASLVAGTLELTPADRGLNVLPLHHTHGLVGVVLSSLTAGASVVCLPGYSDEGMLAAFRSLAPTWYSAVPAIHARVAAFAAGGQLDGHRLRFTRSASAPLPEALRVRLGDALGVPVLQAYALTEAPGEICAQSPSVPVTPGTVGPPVGCEVSIGDSGEIMVRGPHVCPGYLSTVDGPLTGHHPDGLLATGDLGRLTEDGELELSGRLDDVINRAGEKVSPAELENVLAGHPGVTDVVVAGAADPVLGEAVIAVVVASEATSDDDLRRHCARTPRAHGPDRFARVAEIPRSATGKVNRRALAASLGPAPEAADVLDAVAAIWAEVLFLPAPDPDTGLAELGGESLHGARIEALVAERLDVRLPPSAILDRGITIRKMAALVRDS